jgi:LPXTG-motif cell wall-anchored protein
MNYRSLLAVLCIIFLAACAYAQDNASVEYTLEKGILSIPSVVLVIDQGGMVSVTEEIITRPGDVTAIIIPENVQEIQIIDSKDRTISFETTQQLFGQLVSFYLPESNSSEQTVSLKYATQRLTSKSGDVWSLNYTTTASPQTKKYPGTIIKLYTPKKTQITKINLKEDINFSPIGDSEIWFYPQKKEFNLNFDYVLGSKDGPIITRPVVTTTTLSTTTIPNTGVDFRAYFIPWAVLLLMVLLFFLYRLKSKTGNPEKAPSEGPETDSTPREVLIDNKDPVPSGAATDGAIYNVSHDVTGEPGPDDYVNGEISEKQVIDVSVGKTAARKRTIKESILNVLDESEKSVVNLLINAEDEITQAYVYKSTGMPKSSLSDTIKRLEKRNIIKRKKEGRTNWLKLQDWVLD